jgi:amino acid adenylation domain-containing protein
MLTLVELSAEQIDRIVRSVPGGARNTQDIYPLAPLQEGILFHHMVDRRGDTYVLLGLLELQSRERLNAFVAALQWVIDRHDVLRTAILWEGLPAPLQVVYRRASLPVEELKLDPVRDPVGQLKDRMRPELQVLDPRKAPLLRLQVASDPKSPVWYALLQVHHLACDAQSLGIVVAEVKACLEGRGRELPEPMQYRWHVAQTLADERANDAETFFRTRLAEIDEPTAPFGLLDVHGHGSRIVEARRELDTSLVERLRHQARRQRVTMAALFHAAWGLVVSLTSGRDTVVFGTVLFGRLRMSGGSSQRVGMFLNTLPMRLRLGSATTRELVTEAHRELLALLSYEQASLAVAQRGSSIVGSAPLFTSLLNYRHGSQNAEGGWTLSGLGIRELASGVWTNYPLTLSVDDLGDRFLLTAQTDRRISPDRIMGYMCTALESVADALEYAPQLPALSRAILPVSERKQVVELFNPRQAVGTERLTIHELFEAQVERTPKAAAVTYEGVSLTYAQLNQKANKLGRYLQDRGIGPDALVGICVERGLDMVAAILGVLKAGGAYVPLDPNYPHERLRYMIGDAAPKVLLTQSSLMPLLSAENVNTICLDVNWDEIAPMPGENLDVVAMGLRPDHLAYVIYTSGSTGRPKGTLIQHNHVTRLFSAAQKWFSFNERDVWTLFHSYAFDFSVWEMWGALLYGGRVVVVPYAVARSPEEFYGLLCKEGVTVLNQTPSVFAQVIDAEARTAAGRHSLRVVIFGGEALDPRNLRPWVERNGATKPQLVNMYGITETTVHVTYCPLTAEDIESGQGSIVGRPIPDLRVYLLDRHGQPVPIAVEGEIHVGGAGVARGYLNQPELTARRFIKDPFSTDPQARLYKSGDLGRWRPDGTLEYLGRNDSQVKIRGFRIELGEIEARLMRHPQVLEAVVIAREDAPGDKRLVAYLVSKGSLDAKQELSAESLRTFLNPVLPDHMVPSAFVLLDRLPMTPNGKLDRRGLPAPELEAYVSRQYEPPAGRLEELLAQTWSKVLHVERVGRHDNFFELGGHSLLGMKVMGRVSDELQVPLPVTTVFQYPTVRQMAELVDSVLVRTQQETQTGGEPSREVPSTVRLVPRSPSDRVPLAFSQQWFWNCLKLGKRRNMRTVSAAVRIAGPLDVQCLRHALEELVRRHESLRTRIDIVDGVPWQRVNESRGYSLDVTDLSHLPESAAEAQTQRLAEEPVYERFFVTEGPLFVARLMKVSAGTHELVIAMDHLIADRASLAIVWRELFTLYTQSVRSIPYSLPKVAVQFADFAVWQEKTHAAWLESHGSYWSQRLMGARRVKMFPGQSPPEAGPARWVRVPVCFDRALSGRLRDVSRQHRSTLAMSVLTLYAAVVMRLCDETDLVVPFTTVGRLYPEVENTIGFFGTPLLMRIRLHAGDTFVTVLTRISAEYAAAYEHDDSCRIAAQVPTPEILWNPTFNWIPYEYDQAPMDVMQSLPQDERLEITPRPFDIVLREDIEWDGDFRIDLSDRPEGVTGSVMYRSDQIGHGAVGRFETAFRRFAKRFVDQPDSSIATVSCEEGSP